MRCPRCNGESRVYDSEEAGPLRLRRRACQDCGHRFSTSEEYLREVRPRRKTLARLSGAQAAFLARQGDIFE